MRALLLELRPKALLETSLDKLVGQLIETFNTRYKTQARLEWEEPGNLPPDVRVTLYRIVQEALNNIAKHARATQVVVALRPHNGGMILSIRDDGRGFDLEKALSANHYGLKIMRERADGISATLQVASQTGQGTEITLTWKGQDQAKALPREIGRAHV